MPDYCSKQARALLEHARSFMRFQTESEWAKRGGGPAVVGSLPPPRFDFVTGNPYEMPMPQIAESLARASTPQNKNWFQYTMSATSARAAAARGLSERIGVEIAGDDLHLTSGGFAALAVVAQAVADPGDEIIVITPCFFFYESLIASSGAVPVRVPSLRPSFDPDLDALEKAITPRTAAVLVNTPNNPSGRIYPPAVLERLAAILERASAARGKPIYLLSDEAFSRIVYDGAPFHSPTRYYPYTLLLYTYGKTLLAPGLRLGYVAMSTNMPEPARAQLRELVPMVGIASGWQFPSVPLQYALPELDRLAIDLSHLQSNRDALVAGLRAGGYEVNPPEGTFFMLVRSPWADDHAFVHHLVDHEVFVLPGSIAYAPGYFRMSMGVTRETVEGALPAFAAAFQSARGRT